MVKSLCWRREEHRQHLIEKAKGSAQHILLRHKRLEVIDFVVDFINNLVEGQQLSASLAEIGAGLDVGEQHVAHVHCSAGAVDGHGVWGRHAGWPRN
jgi:hypothetical protein